MDEQDQRNIAERLMAGEKSAISELYDHYGPVLYGIILKIVRSEAIAEDVLQESFIKIWQNGSAYDPARGTLFTWMLNIARNTAIDKTRSSAFRRTTRSQLLDPRVHEKWDQDTQRSTDNIGLKKIVDNLESKYQLVIELIYFQGYTQREVQEYLGIPLGTVKSRTRIALRKLRQIFEEQRIVIIVFLIQTFTLQG